ncbi:MAG: ABC transporter permease [Candidatus Aminicenantes bacterium]|nr:ABC transporter permease [Candidatus Aminicenantes bacterium]
MFRNYLKIAVRNFISHPGFSFINVLGLAVGIACSLLILLFVRDEQSFDRHNKQIDRIYRVGISGFINNNAFDGVVSPSPMARALVDEIPEVAAATRVRNFGFPVFRYGDKVFSEEQVYWVDASFFDVFTAPFIAGDPQKALEKASTIVLTRSMALKYFGQENPLGKILNADGRRDYLVTGIVEDPPRNSHFHYDFLAALETNDDSRSPVWVSNNYHTYFLLRGDAAAEAVAAKMPDLVRKHVAPQIQAAIGITLDEFIASGGKWEYFIQPVKDIHLRSHYDYELEPNGDIAYVYIFSIIALGILAVAVINFVNLATARSARRAREVGVRKTIGSHRTQLVRQFLFESVLMSLLAVLLALLLVQLLLPAFNGMTGKDLAMPYTQSPYTFPGLLVLVLVVGVLAGIYPAFFLASFDPATVLKTGTAGRSRRSHLRNVLVVFQFAVSIVLLIGTLVVRRQMNYIQTRNLGFNREQILVVEKTDDIGNQLRAFKQELLANPGVVSASNTGGLIGDNFGNSAYKLPGAAGEETHLLWTYRSDEDFAKTYEIEMAAGRFFEVARSTDVQAAVINESAARKIGLTDPVGKQIVAIGPSAAQSRTFTIIGVAKDFNFQSLHSEIRPLIIHYFGEQGFGRFMSVRVRPENIRATIGFIEGTWRRFARNQAFEYQFFDAHFARLYQAEERTGQIFLAFSILAVFVAGLGLFGLSAFVAEQRTKEIGIRKTLGATVAGVSLLLAGQFTKWVLAANIVAWPLAYYFVHRWLQKFAFRAAMSPGPFILTSLLVFTFAVLTVSYQTIKAATADPVKSLKYE